MGRGGGAGGKDMDWEERRLRKFGKKNEGGTTTSIIFLLIIEPVKNTTDLI